MKQAKTIDIGIICCTMSIGLETVNKEENLETVRATKQYLGKGVVALDLAGAEGIVPLKNFGYIFDLARELELPITVHAGDSDGPQTAWDALEFGTKRIGHGHRVYDDKELIKKCIEDNVTLEICPTSNIQCQSQPSYAEHPAKKLLDMGVRVTINTDNMVLSDIDLDKEYDHCLNDMGFEYNDLIKMNKMCIRDRYNSRSLHDHLVSSKWWDLGRKKGGLFVLSPYTSKDNSSWFRGTADSMYQNISFLKRSNEPYAVSYTHLAENTEKYKGRRICYSLGDKRQKNDVGSVFGLY